MVVPIKKLKLQLNITTRLKCLPYTSIYVLFIEGSSKGLPSFLLTIIMLRIIKGSSLHEAILNETTVEAFYKVESYFEQKGYEVVYVKPYTGIENKTYGDFCFVLKKDGVIHECNIDFKRQDRDRPYIPIELVQISRAYGMDSWLYNKNIHVTVYSFKNGDVYLFKHSELLSIAASNNTDEMWSRCIVYRNNPEKYKEEIEWINEQLKMVEGKPLVPEDTDAHINGAFNYGYNGVKHHSGFCFNIPLRAATPFRI